MTVKKPSETEEEYFARQEAEKQRRLAHEIRQKMAQEERDQLKLLHFMHCPRCGMKMSTLNYRGMQIERCHTCGGTFLDGGELEQIAGKEHDFLERLIAIFKTGK